MSPKQLFPYLRTMVRQCRHSFRLLTVFECTRRHTGTRSTTMEQRSDCHTPYRRSRVRFQRISSMCVSKSVHLLCCVDRVTRLLFVADVASLHVVFYNIKKN